MGDYVNADTVFGHPLSGSGKIIPNPLENQFYSGSDKFDYGSGGIKDRGDDDRITFTDSTDTIFHDESGNPVMYIDTNERIGILKADPTVELEVTGVISASAGVYVANNKLVASSQTGSFASGSDVSANITNISNLTAKSGSWLVQGQTGSLTNITASGDISGSNAGTLTIGGLSALGNISGSGTVTLTLSTTEMLTTGSLWISGSGGGDASGSGYLMMYGIIG